MKARLTLVGWVGLAPLPFMLAGCLSLDKGYPEKRSFVLDVAPEAREPIPTAAMVLRVNKLHVSPLFAGRAMVYRTADLQYESDFYDEWFIAPARSSRNSFRTGFPNPAGSDLCWWEPTISSRPICWKAP